MTTALRAPTGHERGGDSLPEGVAGSRIVGALHRAPDGTITAANDAFLRMAGRTRAELDEGALQWDALFAPAATHDEEEWEAELARPDHRTAAVMLEAIGRGERGATFLVVDVSATHTAEAALVRAREVLEERTRQLSGTATETEAVAVADERNAGDSTAAAHLEAERRRVEELAAHLANANRELDAFSYSVSHDLRTPLRSIDGFSRVLMTNYASALDERGRDYLGRVRNAAQRMSQLLDDLLKLARTSRASFSATEVDLSALAAQIASELQQSEAPRNVRWDIAPGLVVRGDRTLLRVVLENLLGNAFKFTSKREDATIEIGCERAGPTPVFFVRDNGAGFDMAYADQLFGVFQRLHTNDEFEGTGIGLATVQRIVHRHGGEVWAEAAAGRGATLRFTLGAPRPRETDR